MRDIKFRIYSTVTGGFDYVSMDSLLTSDNSKISEKMAKDDLSVMQFTGSQDKKGVDIYEGDIVLVSKVITRSGEKRFAVISANFIEGIRITATDNGSVYGSAFIVEVIGNIHENPELLIKE